MAKKVTIRGVEYASQTAAAKAFGLTRAAIHEAYKRGALDRVGLRQQPPVWAWKKRRKVVTVGGVEYESQRAAAKALGMNDTDVHGYLKVCAALGRKP